jgi:ATP-dependent helicase/nuclease subunit B
MTNKPVSEAVSPYPPAVFTITPTQPFVDALAMGILAGANADPLTLAKHTVLLPTRRAVRALREAFLRQANGQPTLLPRMIPLGDIDEDELALSAGEEGLGLDSIDLPPAISSMRRQFLLARLIMAKDNNARPDQAVRLAAELTQLLDQVQTERLAFSGLEKLVQGDLSKHWQVTLNFLKIVTEAWPLVLEQEGCLDPADRRNRLLEAQALAWRENPPDEPIIAAGSTGSIPATADLLAVVANLPQGCIILPGLDRELPDTAWTTLPPGHPQFGLGRLLARLGVTPQQVDDWPGLAPSLARGDRTRLVNRALWPATALDVWRDEPRPDSALDGVFRIDCGTPHEEALAISLILRQALENDGCTAALITPDRSLARRVAAEMRRWGLEIDDSAGVSLDQTLPGGFLRLAARAVIENMAPLPLLALLKHPLTCLGRNPGTCRTLVRRLELACLRGARPAPGITGIKAALKFTDTSLSALLDDLDQAIAPFMEMLPAEPRDLRHLLTAHVTMVENLAATGAETEPPRIWAGEAGEAAVAFIAELADASTDFTLMAPAAYAALFDTLLADRVVRPSFGRHARLHIWGLLEARLQQADTMVLAGLNEGTWPPEAAANPWMSRPMMAQFGLPLPERRIGLAAHDFTQAFAAPALFLTRAKRVGGTPSVPSRWLLRLETLLGEVEAHRLLTSNFPWRHWQGLIDQPENIHPITAPAPCPPLSARPRQLSVTRIETWMRDPYSLYASHILKLKALNSLDADPGAADYGSVIHDALDAFLKKFPKELPANATDALLADGHKVFERLLGRPGVWAFWWPRFERIAKWFVAHEQDRRALLATSRSEATGSMVIEAGGGPFTLTARADRIDHFKDGTLAIIDYKTGQVASKKEVLAGFSPQLPLEAAIAAAGKFDGVNIGPVSALEFWHLDGGDPPGKVKSAGDDPTSLATGAIEGLTRLVTTFDLVDTPYRARPHPDHTPRYSDYLHLARVKEWSSGGGEDQ